MVKALIGLVAAIVVAVCGFFGFEFYTQHRIAGEIDAAFEQIRASGGKASHGEVSFDLWHRIVTVADIAAESTTQPPVTFKIARLTASGVDQPSAAKLSADSIEATDIEVGANPAADRQIVYKVPQIVIKDYSGPANITPWPSGASAIETYLVLLADFAAVSASSVSAPSINGTINFGANASADFAYANLALQNIGDGKIASIGVERVSFTANMQQAGKAQKITGELTNVVSHDFDSGAVAAIFDPQKANDDRYYRFYGQTTAGAYTINAPPGPQVRIDGLTIEDVAVRPSRLQLPALIALLSQPGPLPTPAQAREMLEKVARAYEGLRIGNTEIRGLAVETPQGPFRLSAIRLNLEDGKFGEFAIEGLDARLPNGPLKIGRFALKSLDVANLLRMSALFANPAQKPPPDQMLGFIRLLEGIEVKQVTVPYKNTNKAVNIDSLDLNWGQFIGSIPSKARLTAKMSAPVDPTDPRQKILLAAGLDRVAIDLDLGAAWTEASGSFVLEPVTFELNSVLKASARASFANVPRQVFSVTPGQAAAVAETLEAGPIEIMVRDTGGVDLAVGLYARSHNVSPDDARRAIADDIRNGGAEATATNPDAVAIRDALARFVENPQGTLTLKLTPRGKVPAMQLIRTLKADPEGALAQFQAEASTGR